MSARPSSPPVTQFSSLSGGPPSVVLPQVSGKVVTCRRSLQEGPGNPRQAVLTKMPAPPRLRNNRNLQTRPWEQGLKKVRYVCIEPVPMSLGAHGCHRTNWRLLCFFVIVTNLQRNRPESGSIEGPVETTLFVRTQSHKESLCQPTGGYDRLACRSFTCFTVWVHRNINCPFY